MQLLHTYHNGTLLYNTIFTKQVFQHNFLLVINTNSLSEYRGWNFKLSVAETIGHD